MKALELVKQKISLIKEMAEVGVIDDMTVGEMAKQLLLGETQAPSSRHHLRLKNIFRYSGH